MPDGKQIAEAAYDTGKMIQFLDDQMKKAGSTGKNGVITAPFTDDSMTKLAALWMQVTVDLNGTGSFNAAKLMLLAKDDIVAPPDHWTLDRQLMKRLQDYQQNVAKDGDGGRFNTINNSVKNLINTYRSNYRRGSKEEKTFDNALDHKITEIGIHIGVVAPPGSEQHI